MLMRSISGIRGIVGEGLTTETLVSHIHAYLKVINAHSVVIGRDSRVSGPAIERLVTAICEMAGVDVYPLGLATTPTVELAVETKNASGGIIITASHNPAEWNALKFLNSDGTFLVKTQVEEMLAIADTGKTEWQTYDKLGQVFENFNADQAHIDNMLGLSCIDLELIRSKKFKAVADLVNGAASTLLPRMLKEFGCEVTAIHDTPDGLFPRGGEPTPENLKILEAKVTEVGAVVGFATDPDADRCALVSGSGKALGEEYTLAVALDVVLPKNKGDVAVNLSTSMLNDAVAAKYNCKVTRTAVGEINVSSKMREAGFPIGGEGNGGVILSESHYGRDAMVSAALTLQWLAENDKSLDDFKNSLPNYVMSKNKIPVGGIDTDSFLDRVKKHWPEAQVSELDGLHLTINDEWIHLRKSNTEPIFRIITESATPGRPEGLAEEVKQLL